MLEDAIQMRIDKKTHNAYSILDLSGMNFDEMDRVIQELFEELDQHPQARNEILNRCRDETAKYSEKNRILIELQCNGAKKLRKCETWEKNGRTPARKQRAIWIKAPLLFNKAEVKAGANPKKRKGYIFIALFDESQTEAIK